MAAESKKSIYAALIGNSLILIGVAFIHEKYPPVKHVFLEIQSSAEKEGNGSKAAARVAEE